MANTDAKGKKLIVEYWYQDGDCGAYSADEDRTTCFCAQTLWEGFAEGLAPSHITIRMEEKDEE